MQSNVIAIITLSGAPLDAIVWIQETMILYVIHVSLILKYIHEKFQ